MSVEVARLAIIEDCDNKDDEVEAIRDEETYFSFPFCALSWPLVQ